jgi:hypothetical protein
MGGSYRMGMQLAEAQAACKNTLSISGKTMNATSKDPTVRLWLVLAFGRDPNSTMAGLIV